MFPGPRRTGRREDAVSFVDAHDASAFFNFDAPVTALSLAYQETVK
jgi:hypothetical protein